MRKSQNKKIKTKTYKFDEDSLYRIIMPDYYDPIDESFIETPDDALSFACIQEGYASTISVWMDDSADALPYDQPQLVIDGLRKFLDENQGLIEVQNGCTADGGKYIYYIIKYALKDIVGNGYHMRMDIDYGEVFMHIEAFFEENGITGMRDSLVYSILQSQGDIGEDQKGWEADPYDEDYKDGFLMNQSEQEMYDAIFPTHPLTKCRQMRDYFITTKMNGKVTHQLGKLARKAQEQSRNLTENIINVGITGKERIQEMLSDRTDNKKDNKGESQEESVDKDTQKSPNRDKKVKREKSGTKQADDVNDKEGSPKREDLDEKLRMAIDEYNGAYTIMNDHGNSLYMQRERATDVLQNVEYLINNIANHPKEFDKEISEIDICRQEFKEVCDYAKQELADAQESAMGAGAGVAGGAAIVSLAPTAAMWVATTFGTASTGTAIATLSGAAAQNAALAWLGGGALAAGGHGMAAGSALLALAGPVGWSVAGATILASIALFANKKIKLDKQKKEEIEDVLSNTEQIREVDVQIKDLLDKTVQLRDTLSDSYEKSLVCYNKDYQSIPEEEQYQLGSLVNQAKSLAMLLEKGVEG